VQCIANAAIAAIAVTRSGWRTAVGLVLRFAGLPGLPGQPGLPGLPGLPGSLWQAALTIQRWCNQ
jgi:hypothetical protein